jgi:hypothetical protein
MPQQSSPQFVHAPNAALLIDFDNVTMGIRSDLQSELRNLLGSDIVKGKVSVQRAYADWRRYPQYIVPLSESSIDLIFAPAYGSSKKNATDIRLAIDALELVFTRPEIGTYILLSGDSDFSSLVIKLKEYGKYVIGVGIRESSSDLLVQNCDEYYSYNALAGLVRAGDEDIVKHDPWELVSEAIQRMKRNGDVMRSDRLKQVMQEIDSSFDEKDLGMAKFSRFVQEAEKRGLVTTTRLENGQLEVSPAAASAGDGASAAGAPPREQYPPRAAQPHDRSVPAGIESTRDEDETADERGRRGRRGRGRDRGRDRDDRPRRDARPVEQPAAGKGSSAAEPDLGRAAEPPPVDAAVTPPVAATPAATPAAPAARAAQGRDSIGLTGERLTRSEAFDLVRRAVESLVQGDATTSAQKVREQAFALLGRDSESLSERNFARILRVVRVAEQLNRAAAAAQPAAPPSAPAAPRGMGPRGGGGRGGRANIGARLGAPPADLLSIGVVDVGPSAPRRGDARPPAVPTPVVPATPPAPVPVVPPGVEAEVPTPTPMAEAPVPVAAPPAEAQTTTGSDAPAEPGAEPGAEPSAEPPAAAKRPRARASRGRGTRTRTAAAEAAPESPAAPAEPVEPPPAPPVAEEAASTTAADEPPAAEERPKRPRRPRARKTAAKGTGE